MGTYLIPLKEARGNILVTQDGSVWANYYLAGAPMNPYNPASINSAIAQNEQLLTVLSHLPTDDMLIGGFRSVVPPQVQANKMVQGIPNLSGQEYPELMELVTAFYNQCQSGRLREFRRTFVLSVRLPMGVAADSGGTRALASIGVLDATPNLDWADIARREHEMFTRLPGSAGMNPTTRRANPDLVYWIHDRVRSRGLLPLSAPEGEQQITFNPNGFAAVDVHKAADKSATLDAFIDAVGAGQVGKVRKTRIGQFMSRYSTARFGQALTVHSVEEMAGQVLPDGMPSMQTMLAVHGYPREHADVLNTFTYLADHCGIGLDIDWALRISFSQQVLSKEHQQAFNKTLASEFDDNRPDLYQADDYTKRAVEANDFYRSVHGTEGHGGESTPRGMRVTAIFALADPDPRILAEQVENFKQKLVNQNFRVSHPVGGQFDLLRAMLPGSRSSALVEDLKQVTTVAQFAPCVPLRRTVIGSPNGLPLFQVRDNGLNQIVYHNLLASTEAGGGSMSFTGVQGVGKSYLLKVLLEYVLALRLVSYVLDHSPHGEYETFVSSRRNAQVVNLMRPQWGLDPLRVFADRPETAQQVTVEMLVSLLRLDSASQEAALLAYLTNPQQRALYGVHSLRGIIAALRTDRFVAGWGGAAESLMNMMNFYAGQSYTRVLFDDTLPAFSRAVDSATGEPVLAVVFRTHGLKLAPGVPEDQLRGHKLFSTVLYTLIARIAADDFSAERGVCALIGDEMSFTEGSTVLEDLIKAPQRMGRKEGNIVLAASQMPGEMSGPEWALAETRVAFKQETPDEAAAAFRWVGLPALESLVERMLTAVSPRVSGDPDKVVAGREGEGWLRHRGTHAFVQVLPMLLAKSRVHGDTRRSKMIRAEDLPAPAAVSVGRR